MEGYHLNTVFNEILLKACLWVNLFKNIKNLFSNFCGYIFTKKKVKSGHISFPITFVVIFCINWVVLWFDVLWFSLKDPDSLNIFSSEECWKKRFCVVLEIYIIILEDGWLRYVCIKLYYLVLGRIGKCCLWDKKWYLNSLLFSCYSL